MGKKDEDGFYYLIDRKANMIITGGEHVYPSEVEKVIITHPNVIECTVIGLQDYKWGEMVTAVCVLNEELTSTEELTEDIRKFCEDKLARFKLPKECFSITSEEMPRTGSGKVIHRILRERFNKQNNRGKNKCLLKMHTYRMVSIGVHLLVGGRIVSKISML